MRTANIYVNNTLAGELIEYEKNNFKFRYLDEYSGSAISLTMPITQTEYIFKSFPPYFDGLLPEGIQLEALLKAQKIDRDDSFSQLLAVGKDLVGTLTVKEKT